MHWRLKLPTLFSTHYLQAIGKAAGEILSGLSARQTIVLMGQRNLAKKSAVFSENEYSEGEENACFGSCLAHSMGKG